MKAWTLTLALLLSIAAAPVATADSVSLVGQQAPTCEVLCVTSPCNSNSDCTAEPNGRCDFVCPHTGCCVYN